MHRNFADWVHDILHTTKGKHLTTLQAWGETCEKLGAGLTVPQISDLVSLSFGGESNQVAFSEKLRDSFKTKDPGFRVKDNYALRVLSGVVLLSFLEHEAENDAHFKLQCFTITATVAASLGLTRSDCRPIGLLETAVSLVNRDAARRREITRVAFTADLQMLKRAHQKLRVIAKVTATSTFTPDQAKMFNTIVAPAIDLLPSLPVILHNQDILQEETEMAWWVQAGQSRSMERPLDEIPAGLLPVVLGFELAERTRVFPSGVAARNLMLHVLKINGQRGLEVSLEDIVSSLVEPWVAKVMQFAPPSNPRVTPLLHLLEAWQERGMQWSKDYHATTGIDPTTQLPAGTLGYAFYQECLASRLGREA